MSDEHELSVMVRERIGALTGYAYLLCGSVKEAEDLVQDAFVKVFSRRRAPGAATSESYVRRAILSLYLDQYRRRRRWSGIKHLVGVADRQESADLATSAQLDVAVALDALTPRQRACVVLRYYEDLTVPQVAEALGCAAGTVKRHLSDAHEVLRGLLGEDVELPDDASAQPPAATSPGPGALRAPSQDLRPPGPAGAPPDDHRRFAPPVDGGPRQQRTAPQPAPPSSTTRTRR